MTIDKEFNMGDYIMPPINNNDNSYIESLFDGINNKKSNNDELMLYTKDIPVIDNNEKKELDLIENIDDQRKNLNVRGLTGLQNIGNTCYMNTVLQCLNSIIIFNSWLRKRKYDKRLKNNKLIELSNEKRREHKLADGASVKISRTNLNTECEETVTYRLAQLFEGMWKGNCTIVPKSFKHSIGNICSTFKGTDQEDSHELLNFILDKIHEETKAEVTLQFYNIPQSVIEFIKIRDGCSKIINSANASIDQKKEASDYFSQYKQNHPTENAIQMAYVYWKKYIQKSHSIITELFTGLYYSKITCSECNGISNTFEPFTTIAVPTKDYGEATLAECLSDFSKEDILTGVNSYRCKRCNKNVTATKRMYIWEPPEVLIIQLVRFKNHGRFTSKTNYKVTFPINDLTLDDNFIDIHKQNNCTYDLWAISEHRGRSKEFGHYVAYGKNAINNKWYEFDDNNIVHIPDEDLSKEVITQNAYMLIYVRNRNNDNDNDNNESDYSDFSDSHSD